MSTRKLPVCPDLEQLKHQAKDLLRDMRAHDPAAIAEFAEHHPDNVEPEHAKLADAQLVLARMYQASSWMRLMQAVHLTEAIWSDDIESVQRLVTANPHLIHEEVLVRKNSNWGPPMTYAANVGRDRIIRMLYDRGARDLESALDRAVLQGKVSTAAMLHKMLGNPAPADGAFGGAAYTLNVEGTAFLFEIGARIHDENGKLTAPVDVVLHSDSRWPLRKHAILEMYVAHGAVLPDTPTMALHRGRIDLLQKHLDADPQLLTRTFSHDEIYPREMGCRNQIDAVCGAPLGGTSLLHMAIDYDEIEIVHWLLAKGMDPNIRAAVGKSGFGGYTPIFNTVVSQPNFWMNYNKRGPFTAPVTELLLAHGADPNIRASIWKQLGHGHDATMTRHEYRHVTPLSWGRRFHDRIFVSEPALKMIEATGGLE